MKRKTTFRFFLEIYTLSTYSGVMSYVVREPETADICRQSREISGKKLNILHETETVGKQCSVILMNSWRTNLVKSGFEGCF